MNQDMLVGKKQYAIFTCLLLLFLSLVAEQSEADHSPTHSRWSIEIMDEDDVIEELQLDNRGAVSVPVVISNENLVSITVDLEYSVPFNAEFSGPESIEVGGNMDKMVEITIHSVGVMQLSGGEKGDFEVTGPVSSRQGLPISVPGDSDSAEAIITIPLIHRLSLQISHSEYSIPGGGSVSLEASLTNMGNVDDVVSEVTLYTNCNSLKLDNWVDGLSGQKIGKGSKTTVLIPLEASINHYPENCVIEISATSQGSGGLQTTSDSTKVTIQTPEATQKEEKEQGLISRRSVPAPSFMIGISVFFIVSVLNERRINQH